MKTWFIGIVVIGFAFARGDARAQPAPGVEATCTPACRSGYVCNQGTCISACNPVCGADELCTSAGECVSRPSTAPEPPRDSPIDLSIDEGWASTGGKLGIATAIVIAGMTTGIVIADDADVGIPMGSVATLIAGVMIPVVATAASSARRRPGVIGSPGLRLAGWIFYGLSIADAVTLLGLAIADADIPPAVVGSVGLLGSTSALFMSLDAFESAKQARHAPLVLLSARPYVGALRDAQLKPVATAGVAWTF